MRAGSPFFADFLPWKWPESVFLVLTKRKADSGDEIVLQVELRARAICNPSVREIWFWSPYDRPPLHV